MNKGRTSATIHLLDDDLQALRDISVLNEDRAELELQEATRRPRWPQSTLPRRDSKTSLEDISGADNKETMTRNGYGVYTAQGLFYATYHKIRATHYKKTWVRISPGLKHPFFENARTGYTTPELAYFGINITEAEGSVDHDYWLRSLWTLFVGDFSEQVMEVVREYNAGVKEASKIREADLELGAFGRFVVAWSGVEKGADRCTVEDSLWGLLGLFYVEGKDGGGIISKVAAKINFSRAFTESKQMYKPLIVLSSADTHGILPCVVVFNIPDSLADDPLKQLHLLYAFAKTAYHPERKHYTITALLRTPLRTRILTASFTPSWFVTTSLFSPSIRGIAPPIDGRCIMPAGATCHITYTPWIPLCSQYFKQAVRTWCNDSITLKQLSLSTMMEEQEKEGYVRVLGALLGGLSGVREELEQRWRVSGGAAAWLCGKVKRVVAERRRE